MLYPEENRDVDQETNEASLSFQHIHCFNEHVKTR